jgi:HlyD family secretion protein
MQNRRPPIPAIILLILAAAAAGYYYFVYRNQTTVTGPIKASGTVEAVEVTMASELSGKISAVYFTEGESAPAGAALFDLDSTLLKAQRAAAVAALATSQSASTTAATAVAAVQAQYDQALATALNEQQTKRLSTWTAEKPGDFKQPGWYFTQAEQITALKAQSETARKELQKASDDLNYVEANSTSQTFLNVEERLLTARVAFQIAQDVLDRATNAKDGQEVKDAAQTTLDDAKTELNNAQRLYEFEVTSDAATKVLQARAKVQVAQENYDTVQDTLRGLQTGPLSLKVVQAQKALDQAQAAANQAVQAIQQAEASLGLIDAQLTKLTVKAPSESIVITRNVEVGEVVNPGAPILVLANLNALNITVYIPEDRYGEISLGQKAFVSVDTFPNEKFDAVVTHISDKAEFTPRNVQTADGRKSTVFAIKLTVENVAGKLKYGMPADVTFR